MFHLIIISSEDMQEWLRTFIHSGKRYMTETCYKRLANVGKVKIKLHCELEEEVKTCSIIVKNVLHSI